MSIVIKEASQNDLIRIEHIMQQVQNLHVDWRPDVYRSCPVIISDAYFQSLLSTHSIFTAVYDGVIAGVMIIMKKHVESPVHVTRSILFVDTMAVDEPYRHHGIGHAFFDFVKNMQKKEGFDTIQLHVNVHNAEAIRMYSDYGFVPDYIAMELTDHE